MTQKFHFRCTANPSAPILTLDSYWEAQEMRGHPDYERIDELGEAIVDESDRAEHALPFISSVK
jgi:hypothetical protein